MAADIHAIFRRGGKELVDLLDYCVRSVQLDPVFVFLVGEYRTGPTAAKALALYDSFCAPEALGRVHASRALPPRDLHLLAAIRPLQQWRNRPPSPDADSAAALPPPLPAKFLFDFVVAHLEADSDGLLQKVSHSYDPVRTPFENLPGGAMTPGQRAFVDKAWEPVLRPQLVAAGFRRIANIA